MPLVIQNDESSTRLQKQFRVVGRTPVVLDEVIVPVTEIGDFDGKNPWEARVLAGDAVSSPAGGATKYSGVLVTPAPGKVVVVEMFATRNITASTRQYNLKLFRPADRAAVTVTAANQAIVRLNGKMLTTGFAQQASSTYDLFNHTTVTIGADIEIMSTNGGVTQSFFLRRGVVLDGTDPRGPISLAVMLATLNEALPVIFSMVEYNG